MLNCRSTTGWLWQMSGRKTILKNAFTVGAFTALSRVLGLAREMLQSRFIGAGVAQSAFSLAFALPNTARKLFGEGALTAAFVPVFRGEVESAGLEKASKLARAVMTTVILALGATTVLIVAGLAGTQAMADRLALSGRVRLTISLVTILAPYMLAICGAAFGMGVLNALGRFKASSFMPSLLNIIWIAALLSLAAVPGASVENRVRFVAAAILAGGFAQLAFMFVCMRKAGVSPRFTFSGWGDAKVRLVWRNLGVASLGAGAIQVNYMLDQFLAQLASPWAAGVIGYAERLMDLPLGVIGVALGTVLLPTFTGFFSKGDMEGARDAVSSSLSSLLFFMVPAAVGLMVLSREVTGVIYEGGEFDAVATTRVARALAVYAAGLALFGFQKVLVPWFHAQNDMRTPLRVSLITVLMNATLNILAVLTLPVEWRHVGLAVSTVVCAAAGSAILYAFARRRNGDIGLARVIHPLARISSAAAAMGAALWALKGPSANLCASLGPRLGAAVQLGLLVAAGMAVYGVAAFLLMRGELRPLVRRSR